jgi:hypothetical protein
MSLDAILAKANATNLEDLPIIPSNVFTNHPLFSILQVPKVNIVACNDFKEEITISQMEIDYMTFRSSSKIPTLLFCTTIELDVSNSQCNIKFLPNINLLVLIFKHTWAMWGNDNL